MEVAEGMSRVGLFEKIWRDREFDGLSMQGLARRYGVHRRTVCQALVSAVPLERKRPVGRPCAGVGGVAGVDRWDLDRRPVGAV